MRARLQRAGQEHLLRFWDELAPESRAALLAELAPLEPDALREHCQRAATACARPLGPLPDLAARLRPLPPERLGSASRSDPETRRRWEEEGRGRGRRRKGGHPLPAGSSHAHRVGRGRRCVGLSWPCAPRPRVLALGAPPHQVRLLLERKDDCKAAPRRPLIAPLAPRFPTDCPEQGGRSVAGRWSGHSPGCHLPQGHVSSGAAQPEDPVPAAGRTDPAGRAVGWRAPGDSLHRALVCPPYLFWLQSDPPHVTSLLHHT